MDDGVPMKQCLAMLLLSVCSHLSFAACLSPAQLTTLAQNEQAYLLNRIPPAFAHAVQDQQVVLNITEVNAEPCTAMLALSVPAAHVEEAKAVLDAEPAKKIMLSAQGYAIPSTTNLQAIFKVAPDTLAIPSSEVLQTAELGQLRASVEMMYSLMTQSRANKMENTQNSTPWSAAYQQANAKQCAEKWVTQSGQDITTACACRVKELSAQVSERQMAYIDYVRSNPYAMATGSSQDFANLEKQAHMACGLKAK
jgi:hypothetical protein